MQPPDHFADDLPRTLELHRALVPKMARCVTPIAASLEGKTYQLGTGTFFRAADFSFLVTAAHVFAMWHCQTGRPTLGKTPPMLQSSP